MTKLWEFLLILLVGIQAPSVIEGLPSVTEAVSPSDKAYLEADQFLTSYGYYPSTDRLPAQVRNLRKHSDTERIEALKLFQKFYNLPQSGKLDNETTRLIQGPRCGHADITSNLNVIRTHGGLKVEADDNQPRKDNENQAIEESGVDRGRRSLDISRKTRVKRMSGVRDRGILLRWRKDKMKWKITEPSKQKHLLPADVQRKIVQKALTTWESILPFKFVEKVKAKSADMEIKFHSFAKSSWQDKQHGQNAWRKEKDTEYWDFNDVVPGSKDMLDDGVPWGRDGSRDLTDDELKAIQDGENPWTGEKWDSEILEYDYEDFERAEEEWENDLQKFRKLKSEMANINNGRRTVRTKIKRPKNAPKRKGSHAHAMVPESTKPLLPKRDIHIDEDKDWSNHQELLSVLLHEIGHSLGLGHSSNVRSVMYPYNRDVTHLSAADMERIEKVYGYTDGRLRALICDTKISEVDDIFQVWETPFSIWNDLYFVISGKKLQMISADGISPNEVVMTFPRYDQFFIGAPSQYDVVFSDVLSNTVFFIAGQTVFAYFMNTNYRQLPRTIYVHNFPETPKFAFSMIHAIKDPPSTIILSGEKYQWTFEFYAGKILNSSLVTPIDHANRQFPSGAKFAVQWTDLNIYVALRDGRWMSYEKESKGPTAIMTGKPHWLETLLCYSHASSITMSRPSLVLVSMLSLIKWY